jgi:hypothetical protein
MVLIAVNSKYENSLKRIQAGGQTIAEAAASPG